MAAATLTDPHATTREAFESAIQYLSSYELADLSGALASLAHAAERCNDRDFVNECDARYSLVYGEMERRPAFRRDVARIAAAMTARRQR